MERLEKQSADSDSENETAPGSSENLNFAKRMNGDFDTRKTYED